MSDRTKDANGRKLSAYALHMRETVPKIKRENPSMAHQDAFAMAAKMWTAKKKAAGSSGGGSSKSGGSSGSGKK